jgi:hypothetical protein
MKVGSPGGTRTPDQVVNSHLLYRLSYRGVYQMLFASCLLGSLSQRLIRLWRNLLYRLYELQPEADEPQAQPGNPPNIS